MSKGYPLLQSLFEIVLDILGYTEKREEEIKDTLTGKKEVTLSLFADNMITYRMSYGITEKATRTHN